MKNKAKVTSIEKVIQAYHNHRFRIHDILEDGQFKPIQQIIEEKGISMNICAADEHVPEIKRYLRLVKGDYYCHYPTI